MISFLYQFDRNPCEQSYKLMSCLHLNASNRVLMLMFKKKEELFLVSSCDSS